MFELTLIDGIIAASGVAIVLGWMLRGDRGAALVLPPAPAHHLDPLECAAVTFLYFFFPGLVVRLAAGGQASPESAGIDPRFAVALLAANVVTIMILCIVGHRRFERGLSGWGLSQRRFGLRVVQGFAGYVAVWPFCLLMIWLTGLALSGLGVESTPEHPTLAALRSPETEPWVRFLLIVSAVVIAPVSEELLFRGIIQSGLAKFFHSDWKAIAVSGIGFGLIHSSVYQTVPALIVFGLFLAYAYARTRSLTLVILIHAIFNAKTIVALMSQ